MKGTRTWELCTGSAVAVLSTEKIEVHLSLNPKVIEGSALVCLYFFKK